MSVILLLFVVAQSVAMQLVNENEVEHFPDKTIKKPVPDGGERILNVWNGTVNVHWSNSAKF